MAENMMCEGQKVPSDKYRENFDKIFKKKKCKDCICKKDKKD